MTQARAEVELATIFGPEMVLQRDMPVPVWGRAEPGQSITVRFAGQRRTAVADAAGRWQVRLAPLTADGRPGRLVVEGPGRSLTIEPVYVGEVWLLLEHGLPMQYHGEGPVPDPMIRIRSAGDRRNNFSRSPQESYGRNGPWGPGPRRSTFDLLSIPFANRLRTELGVPVGIVRLTVGELQAMVPVEGYLAIPALKDLADQVAQWQPHTPAGRKAYARWFKQLTAWQQDMRQRLDQGLPVQPSQPPLAPGPLPDDPTQPTVVFNKVIHPIVPFAFRGVLHVHAQGANTDPLCTQDVRYTDKMRALVAGLRRVFGNPDLAVAFTQRDAPDMYHTHTAGGSERTRALDFNAWHGHRDRQRRVLPFHRTAMVVTADIENYPADVARRFARWALAEVYGRGGAWSGPLYRRHRIQDDRVVIEFDHADGGLMAATYRQIGRPLVEQKDGRLRYFAVAGPDRIFHRAEARIQGNTVVVHSRRVPHPVAVRYACHFDPRGMNLYNRAGLPASPFNTDSWPFADFDRTVEQLQDEPTDRLVAMLGYPTMLHSHAAAKALAGKGPSVVLSLVERLLASDDPDQRCGALRTLGYLYWMGPIPRGYYTCPPQPVTDSIARAIDLVARGAADADPLVRRCAAEALALIGSENDRTFELIKQLAVDEDVLVRTAALRTCKYRFNTHAHNTAVAYALLEHKPLADRVSAALAGTILNHYRIEGSIDLEAVARYFMKVGPGQGGPIIGDLGDLLRRLQLPGTKKKALDHPQVIPAVLHLYALGYRQYFLYGLWRWVSMEDYGPAIHKEIARLEAEIQRLKRDKPAGWEDLAGRYADAIADLRPRIEPVEKTRAGKGKQK